MIPATDNSEEISKGIEDISEETDQVLKRKSSYGRLSKE